MRISLKGLHPDSRTQWLDVINDWILDDFDIIIAKYDKESEDESKGKVTISRTPTPVPVFSKPVFNRPVSRFPSPPRVDPTAARRAAARSSFDRQVLEARSHAASIMAKLGNAKS